MRRSPLSTQRSRRQPENRLRRESPPRLRNSPLCPMGIAGRCAEVSPVVPTSPGAHAARRGAVGATPPSPSLADGPAVGACPDALQPLLTIAASAAARRTLAPLVVIMADCAPFLSARFFESFAPVSDEERHHDERRDRVRPPPTEGGVYTDPHDSRRR